MPNVNLTLIEVDNYSQVFGTKGTEYAMFSAKTPDNDIIAIGVTHNLLRKKGIDSSMLENLVGSDIVVQDDTDIVSNIFVTAEDKVAQVVNKERSVLLLNGANAKLQFSDLFRNEQKELIASTQAKLKIEQEKERKAEDIRKAAERMRQRILNQAAAKSSAAAAAASSTEEEVPVLEDNVDAPF